MSMNKLHLEGLPCRGKLNNPESCFQETPDEARRCIQMYKEGEPEPASVKSDRTCILVHSLRIRKQKCARFAFKLLSLVCG